MAISTHMVEVVPVELKEHPNADSLSIVEVYGYTVCVRTADWKGVTLGAYIPPDSIVPDTEMFAFLGEHKRIKVKKLRGIVSMGMLVPAPEGSKLGDDVAETLGVTHYDPPIKISTGGESASPPQGFPYIPCYDVESWRRYNSLFVAGEEVIVTEKIHGASGRWVCVDGQMHVGSRTEWKKEDEKNIWWRALKDNPWLEVFCRAHDSHFVYGEVYGRVQNLHYGVPDNMIAVRVFDVMTNGQWLPWDALRDFAVDQIKFVPVLFNGPYSEEIVMKFVDGQSTIGGADNIREGVVVRAVPDRFDPAVGRVQLKIVSNDYLER